MEPLRSIRDILDYAIEKENEASSFYKHLAEHISKPELREAVENFSADEFQHKLHSTSCTLRASVTEKSN
jgi:rubrerythrin